MNLGTGGPRELHDIGRIVQGVLSAVGMRTGEEPQTNAPPASGDDISEYLSMSIECGGDARRERSTRATYCAACAASVVGNGSLFEKIGRGRIADANASSDFLGPSATGTEHDATGMDRHDGGALSDSVQCVTESGTVTATAGSHTVP